MTAVYYAALYVAGAALTLAILVLVLEMLTGHHH